MALSLIASISALSFYFFISISERHKLSLENTAIDRELHMLTDIISEDLSCIILIDKGFPAFEFKSDDEQQKFFISFFSSNNEEHITKAFQYCIGTTDNSRKIFTKLELSAADSLFMQNTMNQQSSLHKNFLEYAPVMVRALGGKLLNFSIRIAVKTPTGGIFISPTNTDLTYKNGCLHYKNKEKGTVMHIKGTPLFIDITVRALTNATEQKLSSKQFKSKRDRAIFLAAEMRKSCRRIAIRSHSF